eukprot:10255946-Alexandrium_andersonii.AAC.1
MARKTRWLLSPSLWSRPSPSSDCRISLMLLVILGGGACPPAQAPTPGLLFSRRSFTVATPFRSRLTRKSSR